MTNKSTLKYPCDRCGKDTEYDEDDTETQEHEIIICKVCGKNRPTLCKKCKRNIDSKMYEYCPYCGIEL